MVETDIVQNQSKLDWKSAAQFGINTLAPYKKVSDPIEGIPRKLRYNAQLWRIRVGHAFHVGLAIDGLITENYLLTVTNIGIVGLGLLTVGRPLEWRRIKRMYFPFI